MRFSWFSFIMGVACACLIGYGVIGYLGYSPAPVPVIANLFGPSLSTTDTRNTAIVQAARRVGPSVVSITVIQTRVVRTTPFRSPFGDPFFDEFWRDFFPPRAYRQQIQSMGSGLIISSDGLILTNEHVVHQANVIDVSLPTGEQYEGHLLAVDPVLDLALLTIEGKDFPAAPLGDSNELIIGEWAIAIGNPFGALLEDTQPTVTIGVISALNRSIKPARGREQIYTDMIQTDAAINPGNSGGPLVNANGEVVGINTFIFTAGGGSEGVGFARPINDAKPLFDEVRKLLKESRE